MADLQLTIPLSTTIGSAEVVGTLTFPKETSYAFECTFAEGMMAFVWIRDHLVCHTRPVPFGAQRALPLGRRLDRIHTRREREREGSSTAA